MITIVHKSQIIISCDDPWDERCPNQIYPEINVERDIKNAYTIRIDETSMHSKGWEYNNKTAQATCQECLTD